MTYGSMGLWVSLSPAQQKHADKTNGTHHHSKNVL
jgi:hypothetical protein